MQMENGKWKLVHTESSETKMRKEKFRSCGFGEKESTVSKLCTVAKNEMKTKRRILNLLKQIQ